MLSPQRPAIVFLIKMFNHTLRATESSIQTFFVCFFSCCCCFLLLLLLLFSTTASSFSISQHIPLQVQDAVTEGEWQELLNKSGYDVSNSERCNF